MKAKMETLSLEDLMVVELFCTKDVSMDQTFYSLQMIANVTETLIPIAQSAEDAIYCPTVNKYYRTISHDVLCTRIPIAFGWIFWTVVLYVIFGMILITFRGALFPSIEDAPFNQYEGVEYKGVGDDEKNNLHAGKEIKIAPQSVNGTGTSIPQDDEISELDTEIKPPKKKKTSIDTARSHDYDRIDENNEFNDHVSGRELQREGTRRSLMSHDEHRHSTIVNDDYDYEDRARIYEDDDVIDELNSIERYNNDEEYDRSMQLEDMYPLERETGIENLDSQSAMQWDYNVK